MKGLMKYIIIVVLFNVLCITKGYAQFYTSTEIEQLKQNKNANEGDFYLDTINKHYFIGLTHGLLTEIGLDSAGIANVVANNLLNENDLSSNSSTQGATQQSIKHYVDSLTNAADVSNELFFDGKHHANSAFHDYYYISMKFNSGYCVVRYNKNDVNDETKAESLTNAQPITLNEVVGLTYN